MIKLIFASFVHLGIVLIMKHEFYRELLAVLVCARGYYVDFCNFGHTKW